jgi:hypothetical protein
MEDNPTIKVEKRCRHLIYTGGTVRLTTTPRLVTKAKLSDDLVTKPAVTSDERPGDQAEAAPGPSRRSALELGLIFLRIGPAIGL